MAIVDQYGNAVRFAHAATRNRFRGPLYARRNAGIDELIPAHDRETLASLSRRLFTNMGVARAAILQKADYSVGQAWLPKYLGPDKEAGDVVEDWLAENFLPVCDVRGGIHDWHSVLNLASVAIDRDGEAFVLMTYQGKRELPRLQHIPGHLVCNKIDETKVENGRYAGRMIRDGIIYNSRRAPVAYRISTGKERTDFIEIPARAIIHVYDPTYQEQGRGLPGFTHALEDLKHCLKSTEDERVRQGMLSSLGLIEYNELGGPDLNDPATTLSSDTTGDDGLAITEIDGGKIKYFTAGSGSKIEQIKHESPGAIWESFHDRMNRAAIAGFRWSYSLAWKPAGQGTAERLEVEKARRAVDARQNILWHLATRSITFAVSVGVQRQGLPQLERPMAWSFSMPPRLTVDDGRELKSQMEAWRAGAVNISEIVESRGTTVEDHYMRRANDIAIKKKAKAAAEAAHGVTIDDREMGMLTPNDPPDEPENTDEE